MHTYVPRSIYILLYINYLFIYTVHKFIKESIKRWFFYSTRYDSILMLSPNRTVVPFRMYTVNARWLRICHQSMPIVSSREPVEFDVKALQYGLHLSSYLSTYIYLPIDMRIVKCANLHKTRKKQVFRWFRMLLEVLNNV